MATALSHDYRARKNFGKIQRIVDIPNLIQMQKESYDQFLQKDARPEARANRGLQEVFKSVFPIEDFSGTASLEFVQYSFGEVKYDVEECLARGMTYEAPVKIVVRLVVYDVDKEAEVRSIRDIKEQEIYFGTLPLMTENGTFIVNGTERVVVSQLHRSPGIFFDHDRGKTHSSGKILYSARIIPLRGSWLDLEFDPKDILYVRIDRRRKFPVTVLLKALGYSTEELLNYFYPSERIYSNPDDPLQSEKELNPEILLGSRAAEDILHPQTGEVLVKKNRKLGKQTMKRLQEVGVTRLPMKTADLVGQVLAQDIIDYGTGEIVAECNDTITEKLLEEIEARRIPYFELLHLEGHDISPSFRNTLLMDKVNAREDALIEIYRRLRPSNPPTLEVATDFFNNLFFSADHYDLSEVGRLKLNLQLGLNIPLDYRTLRKEDILVSVRHLIRLKDSQGPVDDIDNLGNRRVRAVGELLENQYRIGLVRMERAIKERMTLQEVDALMPHDLINAKPVSAVVKEFFGTSQLSQFMDQTNPLSEITHKRRLSALGPGGLTRERAGFEVRDVHPTHYGRICPIETPEGPNIGLIVSLSTYARVNPYGFVETPYRKVEQSRVRTEVVYLTAMDEKDYPIAQANAPLDEEGNFLRTQVSARKTGEFVMAPPDEMRYMDVSPNQLVSVSASLIPFLEHDDANRALMGSNMQRQAVPLIQTRAPLVGTGIERIVAKDSGVTIVARRAGIIEYVDATRIVVRPTDDEVHTGRAVDIYKLIKFQRSNQNTCINQKPLVNQGDFVKKGQILADGPSTDHGELALGRNVMVAFMSWGGYNFEDSILVSERIVKEDVFTSIHIEEFEVVARDTKLGKEEISRDIPNVGDEALKNLDDSGIIRVGAYIRPNDILVGKVTPKGESQLTPEEKLLRAIFGEKASDVKDTSLRVPPGVEGIVIDAKVFSRKGVEKDERTLMIEEQEISRLMKDQRDELDIIRKGTAKQLAQLLSGKASDFTVKDGRKVYLKKGDTITEEILHETPSGLWDQLSVTKEPALSSEVAGIVDNYRSHIELVKNLFEEKANKLKRGDELPPGVIKMVKVYVAVKRKLQVGDKMAGRHGNKGVVSRIMPIEDMPYFPDGTPMDVVLNPLGVPSRMNVGQVLETHLGWAAKGIGLQLAAMIEEYKETESIKEKLQRVYNNLEFDSYFKDATDEDLKRLAVDFREGVHVASPVFDGAEEPEIREFLTEAGASPTGQTILYDGRTGEAFQQAVTVGVMYILKLHHLVDDKIHARSIGPYSLVTQQPLGGKAQFGGQRLGEMEVWTMEAYGAAYALQEFLTVKSDDVAGRTRMYEKIVKGDNTLEAGLPESFNVLVKELQALALDIRLLEEGEEETE